MIAGLSFLAPLALVALVVLPALYFLLRLTPPPPRRLPLPTLPLVKDILGREREPARTPWWLLMMRLAAAAAIILAVAGPRWQAPSPVAAESRPGPLAILLDDGWTSAQDWKNRTGRARALIENASARPIILVATGDERPSIDPQPARAALSRLNSLTPRPYFTSRHAAFDAVESLLSSAADSSVVWISDSVARPEEMPRIAAFLAGAGPRLDVIGSPASAVLGIAGIAQEADTTEAIIRRATGDAAPAQGIIRAFDDKGRLLGDTTFAIPPGAAETRARLALPNEILNDVSRLEIGEVKSAGAVHLLDAGHRRRRVALITGETTDTAQPLVSGRYFVARALQPFAELREPSRGSGDPILRALEDRPDVLVLVDVGTIFGETADAVARFVESGGMLIRFAGPGLAAASDDLLPVRLRRGGRTLGGALSWDHPRAMGPIPENSPFAGLKVAGDIRVERQVLAEPDSDLNRASWAVLEDGTPLVTGAARKRGQIVLFHVTADTSWSNLPISGFFVDMLRRCLIAARGQAGAPPGASEEAVKLPPRLVLDGFGGLSAATALARPLDPREKNPATRDNPPGFYGPPEASVAVNALTAEARLGGIDFGATRLAPLTDRLPLDFRPSLMVIATLLLLADTLAVALMAGGIAAFARGGIARPGRAGVTIAALAIAIAGAVVAHDASAQQPRSRDDFSAIRSEDIRSSLKPRLAYAVTGDPRVDEASRAGLYGLGQVLAQRTSVQLDEPIGLDPARDELVFYPMLYWPIVAGQTKPPDAAIRAIDNFMKQGGTIIFDTRDAFVQRPGGQPTPETRALRAMLATLDIPALEPVPRDHVLTKTFYLLDRLVGRYVAGDTWVETLTGQSDTRTPARAGDRVSPIIITSNDLAAAWATDRIGNPMFPLVPGEPRQREMALRAGVNLVMYVMTGNYKADQVHVPALLERLGQ